jgi:hypothetical protein
VLIVMRGWLQVLDEIGIDMSGKLTGASAPKTRLAQGAAVSAEETAELGDLSSRLANLRAQA